MLFLLYLIIKPADVTAHVLSGLTLCYKVLIPTLFPFLIVSRLLAESSAFVTLSRMIEIPARVLFGVSGRYAASLILGSIVGFPSGAKAVSDAYLSGDRSPESKQMAEKTLAFCNNCGITFVISAAGVAVLGSVTAGWLLFFVQTTAAILTGILINIICPPAVIPPSESDYTNGGKVVTTSLSKIISDAMTNLLYICGVVLFFSLIIHAAADFLYAPDFIKYAIASVLEVSSGVYSVSGIFSDPRIAFVAMSATLAWSGVSVHLQVAYAVKESELSQKLYFTGKAIHVIISVGLSCLLAFTFLPSAW
ncbi:sporulation integral membrane protein YlbJ [Clostridia bacterium]|nr:sporulation integral membrane protein YlbJ [Clostridia bacterium]